MSPGGEEVSPLNIAAWRSFPLRARLAELTGLPTFVDNDAKALALGEGWVGAAAGCADYIAMVVSTGVGGGIVLDGRLLDGRLGTRATSATWSSSPTGGPVRAAAGAVSRRRLRVRRWPPSPASRRSWRSPEWVERTGTLVGRAIASVVNLLDLPLAVVSGSVALGFGEPFFPAAQAEMDRCAASSSPGGRGWCRAGWGTRGPLVGAAGWVGGAGAGRERGREQAPAALGPGRRVVVRAVAPRPGLWWASVGALRRMARRGWWHRPPFCRCPGEAYWRFRLVTAYGGDGETAS